MKLRATMTLVVVLSVLGCSKRGEPTPESTGSPQPAPSERPTRIETPTPPGVAVPMAALASGELPAPTAEENRQTDIGAYTPVVPAPSMASKLPCPPGTAQSNGDHVIECRVAGVAGKTLSKRQGPAIWFHKNGKVHRAGSYDQHEWTGRWWEFDEEGRPTGSSAYRAGKEDGVHVTFHPNGKRKSETVYKDGKMNGPSKIWTEEGELMGLTVYADDRVTGSKTFKYKMKAASPEELKQMNDELKKLLDEQKKQMEDLK